MYGLNAAVTAQATMHIDHTALELSITGQGPSDYLESLHQNQLDNGIRNFIPLSLLLINASRQLHAGGNIDQAFYCAEYAHKVSPDFPAAIIHKSYLNWQSNRLMLHYRLAGILDGFSKKLNTIDSLSFFAFSQLAACGAALLLTIVFLAVFSLVRNYRLLSHDLGHLLPTILPHQSSIAVCLFLCVLPLLFGLSITWLFPYWLMLLWGYHNVHERAVIGILTVAFIFIVPLIAVACSYLLYLPQSDELQRLWQANYGYYTKNDIEHLEQSVLNNPDDHELLFSAGLINKREQNYSTALRYYDKLLDKNPRDYRAYINAGNVYFAIGEWTRAVEQYKSAIALAPNRSAAAYFNLTRAYQQKFMFKDAEQSLVEAQRLDSKRIETYLEIYSENFNRLLIDETISIKDLWIKGFKKFIEEPHLVNGIWTMFFSGLKLPFATLPVLALLLINIVFGIKNSVRLATKCTLCGKIMCQRCQRNIAADILCFQCQNFLKKQDQLSFKQKDEKKEQIQGYVSSFRRWFNLFSFFFPGMAHVMKGRFLLGVTLSFIFNWLLCQAVISVYARAPWADLTNEWLLSTVFFSVLAVIMWLVLRAHARTVRSPEIEDNVVLMSLGLSD